MAEKQFAIGGTRNTSYLEDDDPLAELARIVGFQEQSSVTSRPQPEKAPVPAPVMARAEPVVADFPSHGIQPHVSAMAQSPVADLEDELLRAFEVYDTPRAVQQKPLSAPTVQVEEPPVSTSALSRREPAFDIVEAAVAPDLPSEEDDPFGALAAVVAASPVPVRAPGRQDVQQVSPPSQPEAEVVSAPRETYAEEPVFSVEGLEAELIQSLDEAQLAILPEQPVATPRAPVQGEPGFRMPLANFHAQTRPPETRRSEPVFQAAAPEQAEAADVNSELDIAWDLPGIVAEDVVMPEPPRAAPRVDHSMDSLLDDVARYEMPALRGQKKEPAFDAALAAISSVSLDIGQPGRRAEAVEWQDAKAPEWDTTPETAQEPDFDDLFSSGDFELDIEEIEQQLSSLSFDDEPGFGASPVQVTEKPLERFAEFVPANKPLPVFEPVQAVEQQERHAAPSPQAANFDMSHASTLTAAVQPASISYAPAVFAAPLVTPPAPTMAASPAFPTSPSQDEQSTEEDNSFDASLFSDTDDPVEALGDLDVPELEVHEAEEPSIVLPDYDLDIDAEMANLFGNLPVTTPSSSQQPSPAVNDAFATGAIFGTQNFSSKPTVPVDTFDEFERALEDDFRTMLTQPLGQSRHVSGMPLQPQLAARRQNEGGTLRSVLLAACATGVIALVGLGGYMFLAHEKSGGTGGEPRIIAADKGPVKVVPENKGGMTVPNQDKAVYDRVAGKENDVVKQGALVTTEEEPVDVVQKTLVPDNTLDAEAEQDAANPTINPTPVEDTRDARLLPADSQSSGAGANQATAPGGVQVRKVRTMIVKADGTLVPREDPATLPVANETTAALPVPTDTQPSPGLRAATDAPVAEDTPVSAESLASVANSNVETTAPVRVVKTTNVTDNAPIPTARPSDQPVNVVSTVTENGNVKQAQQEVASANPEVAAPVAAPAGAYGVQIASLPSEADANASISKLSAKFGGVIGGRSIGIRKADIPGKGTYYRLRVDVGTKEEAIALCTRYKAAGGSCLVSK